MENTGKKKKLKNYMGHGEKSDRPIMGVPGVKIEQKKQLRKDDHQRSNRKRILAKLH